VRLGSSKLTTRTALASWLSSDDSARALSNEAIATHVVGELAAGQTHSFSITIPASAIPFTPSRTGVYPVLVSLASGTVELDLARSTIVWASDAAQQSINLSIVAPLVAPASASGLLTAEELATLTAPGGTFDTQLTLARVHSLTLAVDPKIVASIRVLGTTAPPAALDWLTRLESLSTNVFPLAYADADLTLQREAGAQSPLSPTSFPLDDTDFPEEPVETPAPSGSAAPAGESPLPTPESFVALSGSLTGIAWPSESDLSVEDLDFAAEGGYSRTLTTSTNVTTSTETTPNVTVGEHRLTVADATVSALLREASLSETLAEWSQAMASLTGALSITATEHSGATLVATLDRDGSASGISLNKTLTALGAQQWVGPVSFGSAVLVPALPAKLADDQQSDPRASVVSSLLSSEESTGRFATVVDEPTLVTGPLRLDLLALLSHSWAQDPTGWAVAADEFLGKNSTLRSSVHIPESSQITFPLEKGNLPIAVRNELNFPVTVYVTVRPERALLEVLNDRVELKIEANSQAKVSVPIQSIANGEVRTKVTLTSATNTAISIPTFVVVNVQAGWETAVTVVLAVIIVIMFGAGIWRTVLRRRKALARNSSDDETE